MKTKTYTIGLDLGDRKHHACVLDAAGGIVAEEVPANTAEVLTALSKRHPQATCVMETAHTRRRGAGGGDGVIS